MAAMAKISPVDPNTPGGRVRAARKALKKTQIELADHAGVSRSHLTHMERNTYRGGRNSWEAVTGALGEPLDYLLYGTVVSVASGKPGTDFAKDANEVALLDLWRKLSVRGKRAFASVLFERSGADDGGTDAIRLYREGDNVILVQEFSPPRPAGGQL